MKNLEQKEKKVKIKKRDTYESRYTLYEKRELTLHAFKIFTPKQMLQRLPIALKQVEAGSTSKNLLNEIIQIIDSLYRAQEITKKGYNSIMNSTKV